MAGHQQSGPLLQGAPRLEGPFQPFYRGYGTCVRGSKQVAKGMEAIRADPKLLQNQAAALRDLMERISSPKAQTASQCVSKGVRAGRAAPSQHI